MTTQSESTSTNETPGIAPLVACPGCSYAIVELDRDCPECGLAAVKLQDAWEQTQTGIPYRPWLHRFAIAFVLCTFVLITLGGTVTSKGAGLAVPDWPSTFNYNMFLFPPSKWVGGIFWEHTHRLMGSLVGMMAIAMAIWLWQTNAPRRLTEINTPQSPRTPVRGSRPWLAYLGIATLSAIIFQGIMGGLRVTQLSIWLAVFHGITAQLIFCMTVLIAAATSRWWVHVGRDEGTEARRHEGAANPKSEIRNPKSLLTFAVIALIVLFIQLTLGSIVRHHGAGLAIPDFPLNYGGLVPPLTQAGIEEGMIKYADNPESYATTEHGWYSPFHVAIHWTHRLWAVAVLISLVMLIHRVLRRADGQRKLKFPAGAIGFMLLVQLALGASIIWTGRHPEIATAHQTLGAILLATTALLYFRIRLIAGEQGCDRALSSKPRLEGAGPSREASALPLQPRGAIT